ncbi:MAG: ABC transporter permease [Chloroflexi bacterium]|nr:ABC transporter permease [Chloroflexota bacterium]
MAVAPASPDRSHVHSLGRTVPLPAVQAGAANSAPLHAPLAPPGLLGDALWRLLRDRLSVAAGLLLLALGVLALGADLLAAHLFQVSPTKQDLLNNYARPTLAAPALWLGTDDLGRSQIVRLLYAARISLGVGIGAALVSLTLGVWLGLAAGYARGPLDDAIQALIGTFKAVPSLFLLLLVATLFEPGALTLVLVIGLLSWPSVALFVRGQTLSLREREYVSAARAAGASSSRLMLRHILPNVLPLVVVLAAADVGTAILTESALSFLGLGIMPPTPSWGNMLTNAAANLARGPWLVYGPGAAIFVTVLALYLLGDGLRDALDPTLR